MADPGSIPELERSSGEGITQRLGEVINFTTEGGGTWGPAEALFLGRPGLRLEQEEGR